MFAPPLGDFLNLQSVATCRGDDQEPRSQARLNANRPKEPVLERRYQREH
jgi:hypothetical protein